MTPTVTLDLNDYLEVLTDNKNYTKRHKETVLALENIGVFINFLIDRYDLEKEIDTFNHTAVDVKIIKSPSGKYRLHIGRE